MHYGGRKLVAVGTVFAVLFPASVFAFPSRESQILQVDVEKKETSVAFNAFDADYASGVSMDTGDVDGDGEEEMVIVQSGGPDSFSEVYIYSQTGKLLLHRIPYEKVWVGDEQAVAVGDIDADGKDEIVLSQPRGRTTEVLILNELLETDTNTIGHFTAFTGEQTGAVVEVANVLQQTTSDSASQREEIIVATGPGVAPRVRVFNEKGKQITEELVPFAQTDVHGLSIAAVNTTGGDTADLYIGFMNPGKSNIKAYTVREKGEHPVIAEFSLWTKQFNIGVEMQAIDVDANGTEEIAVAPAGDSAAQIKVVRGDGQLVYSEPLSLFETDFFGGIELAAIKKKKQTQLFAAPHHQRARGDYFDADRYVEVNISEQTTTLWEQGYVRQSYLISSGLHSTPTPIGEFSILKKLETHVYDGRPEYFFPNTKWNLRYKAGGTGSNYYFHTAYWHNNFGNRMSHGCVNMREEDAEFLYHWADIGTPVWIHN